MPKLLPCPFCGGKAELLIVPGRVASWLVKCKKGCCNQMPHVSDHDAIEEWNTRWDDKKTKPKHGHWVSVPDRSPKTKTINMHSFIYYCSECGKAVGPHAEYNCCPGCGAIMTRMVNQDES